MYGNRNLLVILKLVISKLLMPCCGVRRLVVAMVSAPPDALCEYGKRTLSSEQVLGSFLQVAQQMAECSRRRLAVSVARVGTLGASGSKRRRRHMI